MENNYGVKLTKNTIDKVIDKILKYKNKYENQIMWLIGNELGFNKFKSISDIENNRDKLARILMNESAFEDNLGFSLIKILNIKPNKVLIYEDQDGFGRVVKERTEHGEIFLSFIPIFDRDDPYSVDYKIKQYEKLANENYDIIEGRFFSS